MFINRAALLFLLVLLIVQLIIAPGLDFEPAYIFYIWIAHLNELFPYILVVHVELVLYIDSQDLEER